VQALRDKEFPLEVPVSTYLDAGPDEAEKMMGAGIFAMLDFHATKKIGLRDYAEQAGVRVQTDAVCVENDAKAGDPQAQYFHALDLFNRGVRTGSASDIQEAEVWLSRAAEAGNREAHLSKHWERNKALALRGVSGN
jgi:TPR repeat protein